jgi:hypothetical protein
MHKIQFSTQKQLVKKNVYDAESVDITNKKVGNIGNALNVKKYWKIKMNANYPKKKKNCNLESQTKV